MQSKGKPLSRQSSTSKQSASSACSPKLLESASFNYRNSVWPSEWRATDNESESSDWLSQSVASSTSWSDELESDLTKSLQDQMCLVENTLYRDGNQQLSAKSPLREECRLWQQNFPHLRILGEAVKSSVGCQTRSRQEEIEEQIDEIIAAHGDYDENSSCKAVVKKETIQDESEIYKEKIKKAVIDQIFARIWPDVVKRIEPMLRKVVRNQEDVFRISPELNLRCESYNDELTSGFNSLSLVDDLSLSSLRPKSGRKSVASARRSVAAMVPIKPVVLECSIPVPSSATIRTSSALRRSPARLSQPSLTVKYPSPERLLSPLVLQGEVRSAVKSAGGRKVKGADKKPEARPRPQYDAKTGRMISRDDSRSGLRRNLKTSPPMPWSRHVTLPPIESTEIVPKAMEPKSKRSSSAFFKGGQLNSGSRPNTSLTAKNQVVLSPLDSLQIKQSSVAVSVSKHWLPEQQTYVNCETLQLRPSDQRQRWRNRSNVLRK
uniref:DUF3719 domain-containing protein n=1 Tax=Cuerna arida TaxID=1464854 RepID=A0A1B6FEM9_9HEMI